LILQQAGFRMNVEVLVVGEVKEAEEAGALIDTLHTSPRTMTSVHGASARGGMDRLIDLYAQSGVPYGIARSSMCDHVDLLVHCRKGRHEGHRVDEVIYVENGEPGVASTVLFEDIGGKLVEQQWHEALDELLAHGYERHQSVMGLV
jgi:Flp pilus assembly CpaF family ATPase